MINKSNNTAVEEWVKIPVEDLRAEMLRLIAKHPANGLYLRLCEVGLNVREGNFIIAKQGKAGFQLTSQVLLALKKLPTTEKKLSRLKLIAQ